jgi:hypothetical protein
MLLIFKDYLITSFDARGDCPKQMSDTENPPSGSLSLRHPHPFIEALLSSYATRG